MLRYKTVLLGPCGSGKSTFLYQIRHGSSKGYLNAPTIGVDYAIKTINYKNNEIKIEFWDTSGQERFKSIINLYYKGVDLVFLVFDISDVDSFRQLEVYISEIKDNCGDIPIVLILNKKDLNINNEYVNSNNELHKTYVLINLDELISKNLITKYFFMSNLDDDNVKYLVDYLNNLIINNSKIMDGIYRRSKNSNIQLQNSENRKSSMKYCGC